MIPFPGFSEVGTLNNLLERGLVLFPLRPRTKGDHVLRSWKEESSSSREQIKTWAEDYRNHNWAVHCERSEVLVIDIDGSQGERDLRQLSKRLGELPETMTVATPRGEHLYYRVPGGVRFRGKIGDEVDLKHDGYVLAPGSTGLRGEPYQLARMSPIVDLPAVWLEELRKPEPSRQKESESSPVARVPVGESTRYGRGVLANQLELLRNSREGDRNNQLNRSAFAIQQFESGGEIAPGWEMELARVAELIGLEHTEVQATIDSAKTGGARDPRSAPDSPTGSKGSHGSSGTTAGESSTLTQLNTVCASNVPEAEITWLDDGFLPFGFTGLLEGQTSTGKSLVLYALIAALTTGTPMPASGRRHEPANVLLFSEDPPEYLIVPRLIRAGADLERVQIGGTVTKTNIDGAEKVDHLWIEKELGPLKKKILDDKIRLVVFDPYISHTSLDMTSYSASYALMPKLADLASETGAAIVLVRHWTKGADNALDAGHGSSGVASGARFQLSVTELPEDLEGDVAPRDRRKVLSPVKGNIESPEGGLIYRTVKVDGHPIVEWTGERESRDAQQLIDAMKAARANASQSTLTSEFRAAAIEELLYWEGRRPLTKKMSKEQLRKVLALMLDEECTQSMIKRVLGDRKVFLMERGIGSGGTKKSPTYCLTQDYLDKRKAHPPPPDVIHRRPQDP